MCFNYKTSLNTLSLGNASANDDCETMNFRFFQLLQTVVLTLEHSLNTDLSGQWQRPRQLFLSDCALFL